MSHLCPSVPFRHRVLHALCAAFLLAGLGGTAFAQAPLPSPPGEQQLQATTEEMSSPVPASPPTTLNFGAALAMDARTLLVGMPAYSEESVGAPPGAGGRVAVFLLNRDNRWVRRASIDPAVPDPEGGFGNRIALAERFALVGSSNAVFVFKRKGGIWRQLRSLAAAAGEHYDGALAVSGRFLMLGVSVDDAPGRVDVFKVTPNGEVHRVQQLRAPAPEEGDSFGQALAASNGTLVVGAPGIAEGQGAAFVYRQVRQAWVRHRHLVATDQDPAVGLGPVNFGAAVSMSDGLIAVGAPGADPRDQPGDCAFLTSGAAYIFAKQGNGWPQVQKVGSPNQCAFDFGATIAISRDYLAIGAPSAFPFVFEGAHVYRRTGDSYERQYEVFGSEVSVPPVALDGSHFVAGFPFDRFFSTGFALAYDLAEAP